MAILKASDSRRQRIEPLREEIDAFKTQLGELDSMIAYTPSVVSMRGQNSSANTPSLPYSAALPGLPLNSGTGFSRADFKLPTNLPEFSSGKDVDDFMASLVNLLIAHNVDESRWTSALLVCCTSASDASWVKDTLLTLPWSVASEKFL